MIIIEGPDYTGKTTLAKKLIEALKLSKHSYVHCGPPPKAMSHLMSPAWQQYVHMLLDHSIPAYAIVDRFIYGELVYGPILRESTLFDRGHMRMLERIMMARRSIVIRARPPLEWSYSGFLERAALGKELFASRLQYDKVHAAYDRLWEQGINLPRITWNTLNDDMDALQTQIIMSRPPINLGPGHGMFNPGVNLIIGDFRSGTPYPEDWPLIGFEGAPKMIADQLNHMLINEQDLYWVNCMRSGRNSKDNMVSPTFVQLLKPKRIIAVGKSGADWCISNGITDCHTLPGFDYWYQHHRMTLHPLVSVLK